MSCAVGLSPGVTGCTPAELATEMLIHHNVDFSTFERAERRHEGAMATWHRRQARGRTKVWREGRKRSVYIGGLAVK